MRQRYPDIKPFNTQMLAVDDKHTLHIEQCGEPNGIPILFIHGGPGGGFNAQDRCFFNPEEFHIILFDQRGSGKSTPHADLHDNTSQHLIDDIETIREALNIKKWAIFGGSWGSTLGLLYAQAHPQNVSYMILRGIFLCREKDLDWFYQDGASHIFPDYWQDFIAPIAPHQRNHMLEAYHVQLTGSNELAKLTAAKAWSTWEGRCATLRPNPQVVERFGDTHMALSLARIEAHYFVNRGFISPNQILDNMDKIADIPAVIIHGRYDMVCPLDNAFELAEKWPKAQLHIIREGGHSSSEPSITDALVKFTDEAAHILSNDVTEHAN